MNALFKKIAEVFAVLAAAGRAANAVENGKMPSADALNRLGINQKQMNKINYI